MANIRDFIRDALIEKQRNADAMASKARQVRGQAFDAKKESRANTAEQFRLGSATSKAERETKQAKTELDAALLERTKYRLQLVEDLRKNRKPVPKPGDTLSAYGARASAKEKAIQSKLEVKQQAYETAQKRLQEAEEGLKNFNLQKPPEEAIPPGKVIPKPGYSEAHPTAVGLAGIAMRDQERAVEAAQAGAEEAAAAKATTAAPVAPPAEDVLGMTPNGAPIGKQFENGSVSAAMGPGSAPRATPTSGGGGPPVKPSSGWKSKTLGLGTAAGVGYAASPFFGGGSSGSSPEEHLGMTTAPGVGLPGASAPSVPSAPSVLPSVPGGNVTAPGLTKSPAPNLGTVADQWSMAPYRTQEDALEGAQQAAKNLHSKDVPTQLGALAQLKNLWSEHRPEIAEFGLRLMITAGQPKGVGGNTLARIGEAGLGTVQSARKERSESLQRLLDAATLQQKIYDLDNPREYPWEGLDPKTKHVARYFPERNDIRGNPIPERTVVTPLDPSPRGSDTTTVQDWLKNLQDHR